MPERLAASLVPNTLQEFFSAVAQLQYDPLQFNLLGDTPQGFRNQKHNK